MTKRLTVVPKTISVDAPDLRDALQAVIAELAPTDVDRPLYALAMHYAEQIEQARDAQNEAARIMMQTIDEGESGLYEQVKRLRRRIELSETVAKCGPLLQAALTELLATPAAKAKHEKTKSATGAARMAQLREGVS